MIRTSKFNRCPLNIVNILCYSIFRFRNRLHALNFSHTFPSGSIHSFYTFFLTLMQLIFTVVSAPQNEDEHIGAGSVRIKK